MDVIDLHDIEEHYILALSTGTSDSLLGPFDSDIAFATEASIFGVGGRPSPTHFLESNPEIHLQTPPQKKRKFSCEDPFSFRLVSPDSNNGKQPIGMPLRKSVSNAEYHALLQRWSASVKRSQSSRTEILRRIRRGQVFLPVVLHPDRMSNLRDDVTYTNRS